MAPCTPGNGIKKVPALPIYITARDHVQVADLDGDALEALLLVFPVDLGGEADDEGGQP